MTELINKCKEIGPEYLTKFRMDWAAAEARVNHFVDVTSRCEVKFPDDEMVPILEYPKDIDPETGEEMGDPWTNGRGHRVIRWKDGKQYVLVPIKARKKLATPT